MSSSPAGSVRLGIGRAAALTTAVTGSCVIILIIASSIATRNDTAHWLEEGTVRISGLTASNVGASHMIEARPRRHQ